MFKYAYKSKQGYLFVILHLFLKLSAQDIRTCMEEERHLTIYSVYEHVQW